MFIDQHSTAHMDCSMDLRSYDQIHNQSRCSLAADERVLLDAAPSTDLWHMLLLQIKALSVCQ